MIHLFISLVAAQSGHALFTGGKPIGTEFVRVGKVSISLTDGTGSCGGTLIGEDLVITAAHCFVHENGTATDGEFSIQLKKRWKSVGISDVRVNPNYVAGKHGQEGAGHDVALVRLKRKIIFPKNVREFSLEDFDHLPEDSKKRLEKVTLVGFETDLGSVDYDQKRTLDVTARSIQGGKLIQVNRIKGLQDYYFCQGDSGSPLLAPQVAGKPSSIIGITSFISRSASYEGPGVNRSTSPCSDSVATTFTDLRYAKEWIQSTLKALRDLPANDRKPIEIDEKQLR